MTRGLVIFGLLMAGIVALLNGQGGVAIVLVGFAFAGAAS